MEVIELLEFLQDLVDKASKLPMTNKVILDKDEVINTIDQIVNYLPEEMKKAQWIVEEKQRILRDASQQAEIMKKQSIDYYKQKVKNHEYVKEAEMRAEKLLNSAQRNAKIIQNGARDYAGEVLTGLQKDIENYNQQLMQKISDDFEEFYNHVNTDVQQASENIKKNQEELRKIE